MWTSGEAALGLLGVLAVTAAVTAQRASPKPGGEGRATSVPQTRAERTNFDETSRYDEVRAFMDAVAATGRARVESFGTSEEGRDLPLLVLGDPPAGSPEQARASGRPVVFVMANIHAGEVEGKEALLHLARRLTSGDLQSLLNGAVWLFAPIYNADGNEKISLDNRPEQHGPIGGVGTRENARGLDLNRDFMKLETAEGRALVGLFTRWDPHVVVDLHTTNGSYHGYHLTYAPSLTPDADTRLVAYARERLLPAVRDAMRSRHQFRTYYYGNFATAESFDNERVEFAPGETATRLWRTFDHRPRFGTNYVGLRNRIAILSEAYSYLDFAGRVKATEAFVEEIMRLVVADASAIRALVTRLDGDAGLGLQPAGAVSAAIARLPTPVEILVGAVEKKLNPRSGREMTAMVESRAVPVLMPDYGIFVARERRRVPREYIVPVRSDGLHDAVAAKLRQHGIGVDGTALPRSMRVEQFVVRTVTQAERPSQGHRETAISGAWQDAIVEVPAGSLVVRTDQPLGRLVFALLEPEGDDGLTTWNALDAALQPGRPHPVLKVR
jgi:hypothetical protein